MSEKWVCVAAIAGAFGVKGEVKLKSFTHKPEDCVKYGPLFDQAGQLVLTPKSHRAVKKAIAVRAPEVQSREAAEALKSTKLYVQRSSLPDPEEDEFYFTDLVGLDVKTADGKRMGTVTAVHEFGAKTAPAFFILSPNWPFPKLILQQAVLLLSFWKQSSGIILQNCNEICTYSCQNRMVFRHVSH